ncbi:MAG: helix-turn-helix domain-containing protein [Desulfobacteraceae bacterium]|nr:helix-turn-helix domain-containing protein [Desulfobacteraceae bacterium]
MKLEPNTAYQALLARDSRFDGRFFVGVRTTGIYCRPVCPVKPPKFESCSFFPSAAAAETAGYRPCLRCRPELAPGNSSLEAGSNIAHRAARLIEDGIDGGLNLAGLAQRLGVTGRHLRRVFRTELGASPVRFAQTFRLLQAKRLLTDTDLPVTEVAMASGFSSLRRFNALMKEHYGITPTDFRRKANRNEDSDAITLRLGYRPPLAWDELISFLGRRSIQGVESVAEGRYRRSVNVEAGGIPVRGWIEIFPDPRCPVLIARVDGALVGALPQMLSRVRRLFDLAAHPVEIASVLGDLAKERPGLRVPGSFDPFESAVRAILGQQITVRAASTIAGRFAEALGDRIETPFAQIRTVFPKPRRIVECSIPDIARLGIVSQRAKTIVALARAFEDGSLCLEPGCDAEEALKPLMRIPGIGIWTAQYLAMRLLAWPDAFPHTDHGILKAMHETSPAGALAAAEKWRPWRAYAAMHLWASLEGQVQ